MEMKMKNKSHRYDINRPRSRHGQKYNKHKECLTCVKQHLSNIWSSVHEKVKKRWGWAEKSVAYKKTCTTKAFNDFS